MNEAELVALVAGAVILGLIVFSGPLTQWFVKRTLRGRLWDFVCVSLAIALITQSIVLFNPDALWVGAVANGTIVLVVGVVWLGCRHINGHGARRAAVWVIAASVAVALVSAPGVIEPVDASIPTSAVLLALAVAGVRQCWSARLRQIPEARVLASALMLGMLCAPLWVVVSHMSGTSFLEALICAVAVLTLVPIAGVAMLYILTIAKQDENGDAAEASNRIFLGGKAFQVAVTAKEDGGGTVLSLALVRMGAPLSNDETFLGAARAVAEGLGSDTLVGAFNRSAFVVVSDHPVGAMAALIRQALSMTRVPVPESDVQATPYSAALLGELTSARSPGSGGGIRM